jgi:PAS domain S-box-containing protein
LRLRDHIQPIVNMWNRLIEPVEAVKDPEQRRQSRLLAGLMLSTGFVISIVFIPQYLLDATAPQANYRVVGAVIGLGITLLSYAQTRQGYYLAASKLAVTVASVLLFLQAAVVEPSVGLIVLYYTVVLTLFSSLFLPTRFTLLLGLSHLTGMLLLALLSPSYLLHPILEGPATFSLMLTLVALVFSDYRARLELHRRLQLEESENRYRMISETTSDYAFSYRVDADGEISREWVTDAFKRVTGYEDTDIPAMGQVLHYHKDDAERAEADIQATIAGKSTVGEYRIFTKTNQLRWVTIYRYPIWDKEQNRVVRYFGAAQDITERKEAEAERLKMALQQERYSLVGNFMEAVSHDFRTSLATIETSRYLIEKTLEQSGREKHLKRLDTIQEAVHHVSEQLENLSTLSSLLAPNMQPHALNPLIEGLIKEIRSSAVNKAIQLTFTPDTNLPIVQIDEDELQRAIKHLLTNAVNFTPRGGNVSIRTYREGELVTLEISDTGVGIDARDLPQIFNYFYRADPSRPTHMGGVGLGLSIVKVIVEAHNGTIEVDSTPGKGSTFRLSLPVAVSEQQAV